MGASCRHAVCCGPFGACGRLGEPPRCHAHEHVLYHHACQTTFAPLLAICQPPFSLLLKAALSLPLRPCPRCPPLLSSFAGRCLRSWASASLTLCARTTTDPSSSTSCRSAPRPGPPSAPRPSKRYVHACTHARAHHGQPACPCPQGAGGMSDG